jgi:hypothetical protein
MPIILWLIVMVSTLTTLIIRGLMIKQINATGLKPYMPPWNPQAVPLGVSRLHQELFPVSKLRKVFGVFQVCQFALGAVIVFAIAMGYR